MTPEQQQRSKLLKTRNLRRLQHPAIEQELRSSGFNPFLVADERCERLNSRLAKAFRSDQLEEQAYWTERVSHFAAERFAVTVTDLWDWCGETPMYRIAAKAIEKHPDHLARIFPSGFALIDDEDRRSVAVDLDFDEDEQKWIAEVAEFELTDA